MTGGAEGVNIYETTPLTCLAPLSLPKLADLVAGTSVFLSVRRLTFKCQKLLCIAITICC